MQCLDQERADWLRKRRHYIQSTSNFASTIVIVAKKKDPSTPVIYRMVLDFRKINEQITYWSYPLMWIDRILSECHGTKLFFTLDVRFSYYNITVAKCSHKCTAFTTKYGRYEFLPVPFGVHKTAGYFAIMINETLKGLDICFAYLDRMIYSKKESEHLANPRQVLDHLCNVNIKWKVTKCDLFRSQIHYLGH